MDKPRITFSHGEWSVSDGSGAWYFFSLVEAVEWAMAAFYGHYIYVPGAWIKANILDRA